jgi:hypothetical protein
MKRDQYRRMHDRQVSSPRRNTPAQFDVWPERLAWLAIGGAFATVILVMVGTISFKLF